MAQYPPIPVPTLPGLGQNVYETPCGSIRIYPIADDSNTNPYGFLICTEPIPLTYPSLVRTLEPPDPPPLWLTLWTLLQYPFRALKELITQKDSSADNVPTSALQKHPPPYSVVPEALHQCLIIIPPPPASYFPRQYPSSSAVRIWQSPSTTAAILGTMRANGVPEVFIQGYTPWQTGQQRIRGGDIVFDQGIGYYISAEIGPIFIWPGWEKGVVVLEGYTIHREMVLLLLPLHYVELPEVSCGYITGESDI